MVKTFLIRRPAILKLALGEQALHSIHFQGPSSVDEAFLGAQVAVG